MFADGRQHDACEFAHALLVRMVNAEADAGRLGVWPGTEWGVATHVDRLCSFVEETRRVCGNCGSGVKKFGMNRMLVLSLAGFSDERSWGVSELYVKYCSKEEVRMDCGVCDRQGGSFQEQRRVVMLPNVLVVQVKRAMGAGAGRAVCRTRVEAEREFSVPGSYEVMELWGVVYHEGATADSGHYRAAVRGPDGMFRLFDDMAPPLAVSTDVSGYRMSQVVLLVYVRTGGRAVLTASVGGGGGAGAVRGGDEARGCGSPGRGGERRGSGGGEVSAAMPVGGGSGVAAAGGQGQGACGERTPERAAGNALGKRAERPSPAVGSSRPTPPAKRVKCEVCGGSGFVVVDPEGAVPSPPRKCARCGGHGEIMDCDDGGAGSSGLPELPAFPAALSALGAGTGGGGNGTGSVPGESAEGDVDDASGSGCVAGPMASGGGGGRGEEAPRWKRFTPAVVDPSKCLGRTWSSGRGGQCGSKRCAGADLCARHARQVGTQGWLGKVTGEIPERKLKEFEKEWAKSVKKAGGGGSGDGGGAGGGGGGPGSGAGAGAGAGVGAEMEGEARADVALGTGEVVGAGDVAGGAGEQGVMQGPGLGRLRRAGFGVATEGQTPVDLPGGEGGCAPEQARTGLGRGRSVAGAGGFGARRGRGGRGRVVTGFGEERVEDVEELVARREGEAVARHRERAQEGLRGRAVDFEGRDLDRGAGGAFRLGRGGGGGQ